MPGVALLAMLVAAVPSTRDVRAAAYVGAIGGICGDQPCARDPNIAQVRRVRCKPAEDRGTAACDYLLRTRGDSQWTRVSDTFYRDRDTGRWYLDDNDEDDDKVRR